MSRIRFTNVVVSDVTVAEGAHCVALVDIFSDFMIRVYSARAFRFSEAQTRLSVI